MTELAMLLPGSTPIFSIADRTFDWDDVKRAAAAWGDWRRVEDRVREGLASLRFLEADEREIDAQRLETATEDFRQDRNLLAAEEMNQWLGERGLEFDEWVKFVERSLARGICAGEIEEILREFPVEDDEILAAAECEAICSGLAAASARKLAAAAAFHAARDGTLPADDRPGRIATLTAAFAEIRAGAIEGHGVPRMLGAHTLDWTTFECRVAAFADDDVAREASLCVLEEGLDLGQVALQAGVREERASFLLQEIDPELQARLLSSKPGSLLGPIILRGRPTLLIVLAKTPPRAEDLRIRALAEEALIAAAIEREARAAHFLLTL